jgi:Amt family ammonium transporter
MNNDLFLTKTGGMFVTSILGEYNMRTDELRWVNGGHQPAIIRSSSGNYEQFESHSPPMGVILQKDKSVYKTHKVKLENNRFYAFTDGLSESLNNEGKEIGIDGSIDIIEDTYNKDTNKQLDDITRSVMDTTKNQKLTDDLTVISIGK